MYDKNSFFYFTFGNLHNFIGVAIYMVSNWNLKFAEYMSCLCCDTHNREPIIYAYTDSDAFYVVLSFFLLYNG